MLCQLSSPCGLSQQAASRPSVYAAWPSQEHRDMCLNSPQLQDICYPPGKPYHWLRKHNSIWQVAHAATKPPAHHDGCRLRRALPQPSGPRGGRHAAASPAAMTDSNGDHTTACPTVRLQSSTRPLESHPLRTGPESFQALHLSLGQSMASTVTAWSARSQARDVTQQLPHGICRPHSLQRPPHSLQSNARDAHHCPLKEHACFLPQQPDSPFKVYSARACRDKEVHCFCHAQHSPQTITGSPQGPSAACSAAQVACSQSGCSSSAGAHIGPNCTPPWFNFHARKCPCCLTLQQPKSCQATSGLLRASQVTSAPLVAHFSRRHSP